jgi:hypothetical protein
VPGPAKWIASKARSSSSVARSRRLAMCCCQLRSGSSSSIRSIGPITSQSRATSSLPSSRLAMPGVGAGTTVQLTSPPPSISQIDGVIGIWSAPARSASTPSKRSGWGSPQIVIDALLRSMHSETIRSHQSGMKASESPGAP